MHNELPIQNKIKYWRKKRGFSQREVSAMTGYDPATVSTHELNKRMLTSENIHKYCEVLDVTPKQLLQPQS